MYNPMQYSTRTFLNDPTSKYIDLSEKRLKSADWNEFQKTAKVNSVEIKYNYSVTPRKALNRLSSVKTRIYNPALPTLRKMDRDDVLGKLADEHSRHTTFLNEESFEDESGYLNFPQRSNDFNSQSLVTFKTEVFRPPSTSWKVRRPKELIDLNFNDDLRIKTQPNLATSDQFDDLRSLYSNYKYKVKLNI